MAETGGDAAARAAVCGPSRVETVELLADEDMLPAIAFVFSRNGCDQAVQQCLAAGLRLTEANERHMIREIAEARCTASLADADLDVLGTTSGSPGSGGIRRAPRRAWCRP